MCTFVGGKPIKTKEYARDLPVLRNHYHDDKDELMANWQRMENGETLATITPLD